MGEFVEESKMNWTKTAHTTRICICICGHLGLVPIHTHTHTPLCGYGLRALGLLTASARGG